MAYYVIKTIKGHRYVYLQRTFRVSGEVKTDSRYVCPADNAPAHILRSHPPLEEFMGQGSLKPAKPTPDLHVKVNLERLYLSADSLKKDYKNTITRLEKRGFDTTEFMPITIRYGMDVSLSLNASSPGLTVTATRWKGNREKVRYAYRKALAAASLDIIERHPVVGERLQLAWDSTYRATQDALLRYMGASKGKYRFARMLALKWFARVNAPHHAMKPQTLGLSEWGKRKDWRTEFVSLHAEAQGRVIDDLLSQEKRRLTNAQKEEEKAISERTIWIFERKKRLRRAQARIELHRERLKKLGILRWFFEVPSF
jgi:hypothetical protein